MNKKGDTNGSNLTNRTDGSNHVRYSEHIPRPQGTSPTAQLAGSEEEKRKVRKIVKKKKPRKYKVRNQFRYAKSKQSGYHPHYIFGETKDKYISLGMTTHPKKNIKVSKINSPNPNYNGDQYIQHKVFKMKKTAYKEKREKGWSFDISDLPLIRHFKKKYKNHK